MDFIYGCDDLGDKLECGRYVIRPVLYGAYEGAEPATFEDCDRHGLYKLYSNGLSDHIDDFDTVVEAIAEAIKHNEN